MNAAATSPVFDNENEDKSLTQDDKSDQALYLTLDDLPSPSTRRWVSSRKAAVVNGIQIGLLTREEACARYSLSLEELESWEQAITKHGVKALMATKLQDFRG